VMSNPTNFAKATARGWTMATLSLCGIALLTACSSAGISSNSSSAPATSAPAANASGGGSVSGSAIPCAQITALRSTLTDLSTTSVSPASAGRIASDLAKAEQQLNALKSQGSGPFAAQANQLSNALNAIKKDAAALANSPTPSNLTNLTNAVNSFKSTSAPVIKEMQTACP
jgi:hypothetical protein